MAAMVFNVSGSAHDNASFNWANRLAARRQSEAMRSRIFAKYQSMVGTIYKNSLAARRAAQAELKDPDKHKEWWDGDTSPRKPITPSSSAVASIEPAYGAVWVAFKSNPSKKYYYPVGMGTAELAAKAAEKLVTAPSIGKAINGSWGAAHALGSHKSKAGNTVYEGRIPSLTKLRSR